MKNQDEIDDLVLKYIHDELDDETRKKFESDLKSDLKLQEAYKLYSKLEDYLLDKESIKIKESLDQARNRYVSRESKRKRMIWVYRAAAVFVILISAAIFYLMVIDKPAVSNEKLFASYYNTYSLSVEYRSDISNLSEAFQAAMDNYETGNFETALTLFEQIIHTDKTETSALFFAGICSMELKDYDTAIEYFNKLIAANNLLFIQQANWYLALSYIQTDQIAEAAGVLQLIVKEYKFKHQEAEDLLEKL